MRTLVYSIIGSRSSQLDAAIPASKIAALSSGEFVGMVADDPHGKIKLKMFNAEIINDVDKLNADVKRFKNIPVVFNVTQQQVLDNYYQVKIEVKKLIKEKVDNLKAQKDCKKMKLHNLLPFSFILTGRCIGKS